MGEYGNDFADEQEGNGEVQRAQRRRRTNSFAVSVMSSEDAQSPRADHFMVPSVLQPPPTPQERAKDVTTFDGAVLSVFMLPRPRSADRSKTTVNKFHPSVQEIQMAGRSRGYTVGDVEASYRRHNMVLNNSPSKRKLPFASEYTHHHSPQRIARFDEVPRPATAAAASAHHSPSVNFVRVPPSPSAYQHSGLHKSSPPSKLSILRRGHSQSVSVNSPPKAVGRMSINGMLNA